MRDQPRLIYGRVTGWGRDGPLAQTAGHDINYIALSGALAAMGKPGEPAAVPLNLVGDFGGGSMFLAFGIVAALWERERSGLGQIIDAAIIDGVASLMTMFAGLVPSGRISLDRDRNLLAGAAPFHRSYLCRDGREISVGPLEPQFFAELMAGLGIVGWEPAQYDADRWGELTGLMAAAFAQQDLAFWTERFAGLDACVAPVLTLADGPGTPITARGRLISSRTTCGTRPPPHDFPEHRARLPIPDPQMICCMAGNMEVRVGRCARAEADICRWRWPWRRMAGSQRKPESALTLN